MIHLLQPIFADPAVTKVLHNSANSLAALQRDFGLFVVNLFDTELAATELSYPNFSLAFLLKTFCDVDTDRRFRTADWRIRPMPRDMLAAARKTTHFLIYIHDKLREEMAAAADETVEHPELKVLDASRELCRNLWKPVDICQQSDSSGSLVESVKSALVQWRDQTARQEDDSPGYILDTNDLLALAKTMPTNASDVARVTSSRLFATAIADVVRATVLAR
jgi:exosome complex exonuclease RRP6